MSSRFYRPLEEDANDPRYAEGSPFDMLDGGPAAAYDTPQESPFQDSPPSVEQTKATRPAQKGSPFDDVDPRIKALDDQIASRPRSIGGIIAGFSPHGDRTMANLMAQRHLVGSEVHGDQQLKRQLESSRMMQESQVRHWATLAANNQNTVGGRLAVANVNAAPKYAATAEKAREFDNPWAKDFAPKGMTTPGMFQGPDGQWMVAVFDPNTGNVTAKPAGGKLVKPGAEQKQPPDPRLVEIQKNINGLNTEIRKRIAAGDDPQTSPALAELNRKLNVAKREAGMFGQYGPARQPQPSAAPSTAPGVKQTAPDGGIFKGGNKGQDATGKVYYEQPDGSYVAADGTPYKVN